MKQILTLFTICFITLLSAQETGTIVGSLADNESPGQPLPFANVLIKGTTKGTTTDFDGNYTITNVAPGTYTLEFSFVGYETVDVPNVLVEANQSTTINTGLGASAAALDEVLITVTTSRERAEALLVEQRKASTISAAIGAQELARKGVSDAAGAVSQISGVSKQQGNSNVYVRGLGDRYLNTTYNGLSLPSNTIEKKNIDLGLFSSDVIQAVSVSKAYGSNFYGDFAAGNVDIQSKDYSGDGFLDVDLGAGINTNAIQQDRFLKQDGFSYAGFYSRYENDPYAVVLSQPVDAVGVGTPINLSGSISGGDSFTYGDDNSSKISYFITAGFGNNFEYRQGRAISFSTVEQKAFPQAEEYEYSTTSTGMANIVWRPNGDHKVTFNSLAINNSSSTVGRFGIGGQGRFRDAILDTDAGFYQQNSQIEQDVILVNQLLSTHRLDQFTLDIGIGFNKVFARQPDRKRFAVEQFYNALDDDPTTFPTFFSNVAYDNQRYFQNISDDELTSRLNLGYEANENLTLNFGYNGRQKERDFDNIRYGYDLIAPNTPIANINNLNAIFTPDNLGILYNTEVFNPLATNISATNRPGSKENEYTGSLSIHAGFINADITSGEKWTFVPGVRIESFNQRIDYNVINLASGSIGFNEAKETFVLPSLSIKYAVKERQNIRFAASKTVSTPEFKEVSPFVYINVGSRIGGNPDILDNPAFSEIYNLDLKYEWFGSKADYFSVAAFAKQINDPVNLVVANDATGTQRFTRSGDKAEVLGVELEARKAILKDENDDNLLALGMNATLMDTRQDLRNSEGFITTTFDRDSDALQGASPFLLNLDASYTPTFGSYKPTANVVFSYFSDRIDALGSGRLGNIVEKSVASLDLILKNNIGDHFEINASARNLLDPTIEYVRETSQGEVPVNSSNGKGIASYKRGINLGLQLKYKF